MNGEEDVLDRVVERAGRDPEPAQAAPDEREIPGIDVIEALSAGGLRARAFLRLIRIQGNRFQDSAPSNESPGPAEPVQENGPQNPSSTPAVKRTATGLGR